LIARWDSRRNVVEGRSDCTTAPLSRTRIWLGVAVNSDGGFHEIMMVSWPALEATLFHVGSLL